ncbi:MAG: SDR family NAD(P)-dependent oxidoreductase [Rubrobacter sp.]|nr:SDR family NAD(P)-dependent oxidoreductase [Rubrobacter sp.]
MLRGKVAMITGASRGLGRALTLAYAEEGANLVITSRSAESFELVAEEAEGTGVEVLAIPADISRSTHIEKLIDAAVERFGRIEVLINNAGLLGPRVPIEEYPEDEWRRVLEANLTGPFLLTKAVIPYMPKGGSIINITSGVSIKGRPRWGAYSVTKFGLEGLTQILAAELEERSIRVNSVDPGSMRTEMRAAAYPDEDPTTLITPEENTSVFLYLASDESRNVTGERFKAKEFTAL